MPIASLPRIVHEIARVTSGHFVATVRPVGSTPTIFVDSIETARRFELDHARDLCAIEFLDGRRIELPFHLFTADELRCCFVDQFEIEDLSGLDIFHGRFAPDERWNPPSPISDRRFANLLARLEEKYARNRAFMERAMHLLLVGRRRLVAGIASQTALTVPAAANDNRRAAR